MNRLWRPLSIVLSCLAACLVAVGFVNFLSGRDLLSESGATAPDIETAHRLRSADDPNVVRGVRDPVTQSADIRLLDEEAEVIGVVVNGHSRAYVLQIMSFAPTRHVVNDLIEGVPVTATYCNLCDRVRVFTKEGSHEALDVAVDSALRQGKMLLLVDRREYLHDAEDVPLDEMDFERASWKEWKTEHPDSDIYVGTWRPSETEAAAD
jgi:hypothetical protein